MMKMRDRRGLLVAGLGVALLVVGASAGASAAKAAVSGNFNLKTEGYEVLTPSGGAASKLDIEGIGQLVASPSGSISGAETFTSVDSSAGTEDVCTGTVAGTITPPAGTFASGTGNFTVSLTYTPSSSGVSCIPSTTTLTCSRALFHLNNASNLAAGEYRCIATGVTAGAGATAAVNGASLRAQLTNTRGANGPTN